MDDQDLMMRMLELTGQGFACSQMLLIFGLEMRGEENPALVRAMTGLNEGICGTGKLCGALSGGCCLLSYFAGKGSTEEEAHIYFQKMIADLVNWFEEIYGQQYGGIDCDTILDENLANRMQRCPFIVQGVFEKCMELLQDNGCLE